MELKIAKNMKNFRLIFINKIHQRIFIFLYNKNLYKMYMWKYKYSSPCEISKWHKDLLKIAGHNSLITLTDTFNAKKSNIIEK